MKIKVFMNIYLKHKCNSKHKYYRVQLTWNMKSCIVHMTR